MDIPVLTPDQAIACLKQSHPSVDIALHVTLTGWSTSMIQLAGLAHIKFIDYRPMAGYSNIVAVATYAEDGTGDYYMTTRFNVQF